MNKLDVQAVVLNSLKAINKDFEAENSLSFEPWQNDLDSMDLVDLAKSLEKQFNIIISDYEIEKWRYKTLQQIVDYVVYLIPGIEA